MTSEWNDIFFPDQVRNQHGLIHNDGLDPRNAEAKVEVQRHMDSQELLAIGRTEVDQIFRCPRATHRIEPLIKRSNNEKRSLSFDCSSSGIVRPAAGQKDDFSFSCLRANLLEVERGRGCMRLW